MLHNINNILLLFAFVINVALSMFLMLHNRKSAVNVSLSLVVLSLSVWSLSYVVWSVSSTPLWIKFWINMTFFSTALMPAFFLYFALVFPKTQHLSFNETFAIFAPALVFGAASFTPFIAQGISPAYIEPVHGDLYFMFVMYIVIYLALTFFHIVKKYLKSVGKEKLQLQYILVGAFFTTVIGLFANVILVTLGVVNIGPFMMNAIGPASTLVVAAFVTYAIVRHKLLGIDVVFYRIFYFLVFLAFAAISIFAIATHTFKNIIFYYTILANIALGVFVLLNAPRRKTNIYFFTLAMLIGLWSTSLLLIIVTHQLIWAKITYALASYIPLIFLLFVRVFPREAKKKEEISKYVVLVLSSIFMVLSFLGYIVSGVDQGANVLLGPYFQLFIVYFAVSITFAFIELYINYTVAKGINRMQVRYLFFGSLLSTIGGFVFGMVLPMFGFSQAYVFAPPSTLIMVAFISYAIVKHRLMSVEIVIQRSVIYTVLAVTISLIYVSSVFVSEYLLREIIGYSSISGTIFTAVIIALIYQPFMNRLQGITGSLFFKGKYDYQRVLMETSKKVSSVLNLHELVALVVNTLVDTMRLDEISFLMLDKEKNKYKSVLVNLGNKQICYKKLEINADSSVIKWMKNCQSVLVRDEIEAELSELPQHDRAGLEAVLRDLEKLEFDLWVPVILKGEIIAVICLGYKLSGDMYSGGDIELMLTLSNQLAVALDNSMMYSAMTKQYEELKTTKDKLVQADKMASLGNMAAGMAHEIKNPLSSLKVFSQLLAERFDDPSFRKKFQEIIPKEINRIDKIIEGLLSFAKAPEPKLVDVDLEGLINETLEDMKAQVDLAEVKVKLLFEKVPKIQVDKEQISRVFSNLILNAMQAMQPGGILTIASHLSEGAINIKISDTGAGISPENLKHIFDPFFTTKHYGTGLGLAIVHSIIARHKGKIDYTSEEGKGTEVTVTLPLK